MKVQYMLGTLSYTNETEICNTEVLEKQLKLPIPLITAVQILTKKHKKLKKIYVGKEIQLDSYQTNYFIRHYDIPFDDCVDLLLQGYKRACLLNYKKYDQILVGMKEEDEVVPDYFALRTSLEKLS